MAVQIELSDAALAAHTDLDEGLHEIAHDIAYLRTILVNVVFAGDPLSGDRGWILVDTGVMGAKSAIVRAAESRFGKSARPSAIVQTHGHFDHVGALEELSAEWDTPIYAHPAEFPYLTGQASYPKPDTDAGGGLMPRLAPLFPRSPIDVSNYLLPLPESGTIPSMPGWSWIHTPGHTPGHVSLWRESDRTLIAGDAIITTGQESAYEVAVQKLEIHGPPRYFTPDWKAARLSVERLVNLKPRLLITGHGRAVSGAEVDTALVQLSADFVSIAVPEHLR